MAYMKKYFNGFLIAIALLFLLLVGLVLKPVPMIAESEAIKVTGKVAGVYQTGIKDVHIAIEGSTQNYYINRGVEAGLNIKDLNQRLVGQEVTLYFPKYWTPLDWNNRVRHLSRVDHSGQIIYTELLTD